MKQVTLAQPMRGVGDRPVLPDDVADRLVASGEALSAEPWPPAPPPVAPRLAAKPKRAAATRGRPGAPDLLSEIDPLKGAAR